MSPHLRVLPRRSLAVLILLVALQIAACGSDAADVTPTSPLAGPESPLAAQQGESPLPPPASTGCDMIDLRMPTAGAGVVCGRAIAESPNAKVLMSGEIFLAPLVYGEVPEERAGEEPVPFISLNVGTDKVTDARTEEGAFAFFDVPPGEYGIVFYVLPQFSYLVPDASGFTLIFEVKAGEVVRLPDFVLP